MGAPLFAPALDRSIAWQFEKLRGTWKLPLLPLAQQTLSPASALGQKPTESTLGWIHSNMR